MIKLLKKIQKLSTRQKLVNNIFINTQSACKGTSTKSQKQFPKTGFTFLCIQNYKTNMNQDYIISYNICDQISSFWPIMFGKIRRTFKKPLERFHLEWVYPLRYICHIYCDHILLRLWKFGYRDLISIVNLQSFETNS